MAKKVKKEKIKKTSPVNITKADIEAMMIKNGLKPLGK